MLEKGGLRRGGDKIERLQKRIWFINQILGRKTSEEQETTTQKVCQHACLCIYMVRSIYCMFPGFRATHPGS